MYGKLVTAEEAVMFSSFGTTNDMEIVREIEHAFLEAHQEDAEDIWKKYYMFYAIWNAGRIQGIREERRKRIS